MTAWVQVKFLFGIGAASAPAADHVHTQPSTNTDT